MWPSDHLHTLTPPAAHEFRASAFDVAVGRIGADETYKSAEFTGETRRELDTDPALGRTQPGVRDPDTDAQTRRLAGDETRAARGEGCHPQGVDIPGRPGSSKSPQCDEGHSNRPLTQSSAPIGVAPYLSW